MEFADFIAPFDARTFRREDFGKLPFEAHRTPGDVLNLTDGVPGRSRALASRVCSMPACSP